MLHEHPRPPHLLRHRIGGQHTRELNHLLKPKLVRPFPRLGQQRAITHHHQPASIRLAGQLAHQGEGFQRVQRTLFGDEASHRQKPRRHRGRRRPLKPLLIGTGRTDQDVCRLGAKGDQTTPHRLVFDNHGRRELKQTAVALLQALHVTLRRRIRAAEMNRQGDTRAGQLHHPNRMKAELHHHHIRPVAAHQKHRHA